MDARIIVVFVYLLITLLVGLIFRRKSKQNKIEFFLAGRKVSKLLLFFTMAATNFSAFTIFGFSGAGYRIGYAFYPVMGFGTGFMALALYAIGSKILVLSKKRNYITPADFIGDRYGSQLLKKVFSLVMVVFTLPYLAIQAIASGKSLNSLVGIPYLWGVILVTVFIVTYVTLGGLRSIVWTDLIQGIMMIGFTLAAFIIIAQRSGGFVNIHETVYESSPELFSRPGGQETMLYGVWFGYMVLWFFADPMFPQLFQRFMAAKNRASLKTTVVLYPLITTFLFFLTVSIGVMGRYTFPQLSAAQSDNIFPLLLGHYTGTFVSTILLTGSIAALMSTMDSQLLTLTSMVTNDFFSIKKRVVLKEKMAVIVLGGLGFLLAIKPPQTILDFINKTTFNGLSVLAPAVIGGLYWQRASKHGALWSIVAGEAIVLAYYFGLIQLPAVLPVVPILAITTTVFVAVSLITSKSTENVDIVFPLSKKGLKWMPAFLLIFILGNDFWAWNRDPYFVLGLPLWVWYFAVLGVLMALAFRFFLDKNELVSRDA